MTVSVRGGGASTGWTGGAQGVGVQIDLAHRPRGGGVDRGADEAPGLGQHLPLLDQAPPLDHGLGGRAQVLVHAVPAISLPVGSLVLALGIALLFGVVILGLSALVGSRSGGRVKLSPTRLAS